MTTYIEFHFIQLVPPSCINRDDTGSPKSARFGGVQRHRVSSQAWKRAARREFQDLLDTDELGERTKTIVSRIASQIVDTRPEVSEEDASGAAARLLKVAGIATDAKKSLETSYLIFVSRAEINRLAEMSIREIDGETFTKKQVRQALEGDTAIDIALFGRMIADAPERNVDAACQVEHALSVHKATQEFDYFTAVDDNAPEDNAGAGMIGTTEFISSTLYRYATINVDQLVANLGSTSAARRAVEAFTRAFALSMPTGKQNSFANRTRPDFILVEVRDDQPVSLVNAFETPVANDGHAVEKAVEALVSYAVHDDAQYGVRPTNSYFMLSSRIGNPELKTALGDRSEDLTFPEIVERAGLAVETDIA